MWRRAAPWILVLGLIAATAQAGPSQRRFLDAVERLRNGARWQTRMEAAVVLGSSEDPRARKPLERGLGDPHYAVRAAAVRALVRLGDARAVPSLLDGLTDPEPFVRTEARKAVGRFDLDDAHPYLVHALRRHSDSRVKLTACERLAERLDAATIEVILDATSDADPVGRYAVSVLAALPEDGGLKAFLRGLEHRDYLVQVASIQALSDLDDPRGVEPVVRMLDTRVPDVVVAATEALRALRAHLDPRTYRVNALRARNRFARARALRVLGVLGDDDARRILIGALDDPDLVVRGAAVSALGGLGELRALPKLEQMRTLEENARIISAVKVALHQLRRLSDSVGDEAVEPRARAEEPTPR